MYKGLLIGLCCLPFTLYAVPDFERSEIKKRIEPLGDVRIKEEMTKDLNGKQAKPEAEEISKKDPVEKIYQQYCQVCHQAGVAGAPKYRVASDWAKRLEEKKLDGLTASAIKGLNAMPPKGTCMQCTEEEIRAVVEYMVPQA